jgi:hypothetical protein
MSNPDPYEQLQKRLGNASPGTSWKKTARISRKPVLEDTDLEVQQDTFLDPVTQRVMTLERSKHYLLACGCRVSSPSQIRSICPGCARSWRVRITRRMQLCCDEHVMCLRCRQKRRRQLHGGGFWRTLFAIVLWPLFDLVDDDVQPPTQP